MNYILKAAVVAVQIDNVNGNTIYFTDGSTLEIDDAFVSQQTPVAGAYVVDGVKVIPSAEFEGMYCEQVTPEPVDEGEVIGQLREELLIADEILDENVQEIDDLKSRLSAAETAGGEGANVMTPLEGAVPSGDTVDADGSDLDESGTEDAGDGEGTDPALV